MKKIALLILSLTLLVSCGEDKQNTEIEKNEESKNEIKQEIKLEEKIVEKTKRDNSNDGSSLKIEKTEINVENINGSLILKNGTIISEGIDSDFPIDFPIYNKNKIYKNSKIKGYAITDFKEISFKEMSDFYIEELAKIGWKWSIFELPEDDFNYNTIFLEFKKSFENGDNKTIKITFKEKAHKILSEELGLKGKFVEIKIVKDDVEPVEENNTTNN